MKHNTVIRTWNRLSYPLWEKVRPQSEMLRDFVYKTLKDNNVGTVRLYNSASIDGDEFSGDWFTWELASSILEDKRLVIQEALEAHFGEHGQRFRWDGFEVITGMRDVYALGRWPQ